MAERPRTHPVRRRHISREMLAAGVAVAALAVALAHPAVMSMAGLDLSRQSAFGQIDPVATGSLAEHETHGLAGVIKPLRMKD